MLLSLSVAAMRSTLDALKPGATAAPTAAVSFAELQRIVGSPDYWSREERYRAND